MTYWKWRSPNEVTHLIPDTGTCVTCGRFHDTYRDHHGLYMFGDDGEKDYLDPVSTARPYPNAYTEVLIAGMGRTRDEIKKMQADLMTREDVRGLSTTDELIARMHRTVSSITSDLRSF